MESTEQCVTADGGCDGDGGDGHDDDCGNIGYRTEVLKPCWSMESPVELLWGGLLFFCFVFVFPVLRIKPKALYI
jgi:hypothetical protein